MSAIPDAPDELDELAEEERPELDEELLELELLELELLELERPELELLELERPELEEVLELEEELLELRVLPDDELEDELEDELLFLPDELEAALELLDALALGSPLQPDKPAAHNARSKTLNAAMGAAPNINSGPL